jgi:hypothetical protein
VRLWVAYPHQNLAAAAGALDDPKAALAAASRLAGLGAIELPSFGPFAVPPSDAIAIAVDSGGENLAVTVEVFPAVALLARAAGLVAGNPVLRGGTLDVGGRPARASWRGRAWSMVATTREASPPMSTDPPADEGFAFLALRSPLGGVAAGTYRLRREGADLVLGSGDGGRWAPAAVRAEALAREHDLAFLGLRSSSPAATTVLVLPRTGGRGLELPDAAVAWSGDVERWELPGEDVVRLLGLDLLETRNGVWSVRAMDDASLALATRVAPELGETAGAAAVALLLWVRPRDYLPLVAAIAAVLDALPIAPPREVERWRDLETVLEAVGPLERVSVTVAADGAEARLGRGHP